MIEEFSFENYRSFKTITTLNMTAANVKSQSPWLNTNNIIQKNNQVPLLKAKAIYGANASGKSNIVKALVSFIHIVVLSVKDEKVLEKNLTPFLLSDETWVKPVFFQLIFRYRGVRYRYGFQADNMKIQAEWLYGTPGKREQPYFIREGKMLKSINKTHFPEGETLLNLLKNDKDNPIFRQNSLFLTSLSSFGVGKLSKMLVDEIGKMYVIDGLTAPGAFEKSKAALELPEMKKQIESFLSLADTGVHRLEMEEMSLSKENEHMHSLNNQKKKRVMTVKDFYNAQNKKVGTIHVPISIFESQGTNKMFEISFFIITALKEGRTLIIDEFDARFHPLITQKLVELFNSSANSGGQLIFVTHDTNLLSAELLRRDQIDFVEKDKYGASHLYTLVQFKGIRDTDLFEKNYIRGKYGAIPFVGGLNSLFAHFEDNAEA
jgi:AAA15 family ATPase/GTPase